MTSFHGSRIQSWYFKVDADWLLGNSICQEPMTLHTVQRIAQGLKDGIRILSREDHTTFQGLVRLRNGAPNLVIVLFLQPHASKLLFDFSLIP